MKQVLRSKSGPRSKSRPSSAASCSFSLSPKPRSGHERVREDATPLRQNALYCTPHMKVPGVLFVCPLLVTFKPDLNDQHVREFGGELYTVTLEVQDILQCGGITMPHSDGGDLCYFLQLQIRTLNGKHFRLEDVVDPWFVVFRLMDKRDLNRVTSLLLEAKKEVSRGCPSSTQTSVPFPCLDCMAELEHVLHHHQLQQELAKERSPSTASRLFAGWTKFLSGPADSTKSPQEVDAQSDPGSPIRVEKVMLRLPENLDCALLTKDLAEALLEFLPVGLRLPGLVEWVLRYTPKAHGVSLSTMFRNMAERDKTIVIIKDTEDFVFGGFATSSWQPAGRFYGSGEAFVFSFGRTEQPAEVQFFPWSSENECCMYADKSMFGMGGGEGRLAFVIQSDLLQGHSSPTVTFQNPTLASKSEFVVRDIEMWSIEIV